MESRAQREEAVCVKVQMCETAGCVPENLMLLKVEMHSSGDGRSLEE